LLIHADHSRLLTDADVERATDELRRVRVETVPGGHAVLWDALAESSAHVRSFLVAKKTA
jgi:pimeloyl-ACP methyl ester carboxylesterase